MKFVFETEVNGITIRTEYTDFKVLLTDLRARDKPVYENHPAQPACVCAIRDDHEVWMARADSRSLIAYRAFHRWAHS